MCAHAHSAICCHHAWAAAVKGCVVVQRLWQLLRCSPGFFFCTARGTITASCAHMQGCTTTRVPRRRCVLLLLPLQPGYPHPIPGCFRPWGACCSPPFPPSLLLHILHLCGISRGVLCLQLSTMPPAGLGEPACNKAVQLTCGLRHAPGMRPSPKIESRTPPLPMQLLPGAQCTPTGPPCTQPPAAPQAWRHVAC